MVDWKGCLERNGGIDGNRGMATTALPQSQTSRPDLGHASRQMLDQTQEAPNPGFLCEGLGFGD